MVETVRRTPATDGPPGCYALHRGDDGCEACPHEAMCERASAANRARPTVREPADAAVAARRTLVAGADVSPVDLVRAVSEAYSACGGKPYGWDQNRRWTDAAALVLASCRAAGWDPRTYCRAQAETMGWFCVNRGVPFTPRMLVGDKAVERFSRWVERNARKHGDATRDRATDPDDMLVAGECLFAERYLACDDPASAVEAVARNVYPGWSLAATRGLAHVRLPALVAGLATVDPALPHRMLAPPDPAAWRWPDARAAARALYGDEGSTTARPEVTLSPELGMLL